MPWISHFVFCLMGGLLRGSRQGHPFFPAMAGWEMPFTMFPYGMGGVLRGCGRSHSFFPAMAGWDMALTMFSHMGWVVFSAVADEATHCYPHCLFVKCH